MFKIKKSAQSEPKDIRLSVPYDLWSALELVAARDGVEWQEVARQAMAHALRSEMREARKIGTAKKGADDTQAPGESE